MESTIHQASKSTYVVVGPEGATNFTIIKGAHGEAGLIDGDIRRIDEIEEALKLTGCWKNREEVAKHMLSGEYAPLRKKRMMERNINQFLTRKWY